MKSLFCVLSLCVLALSLTGCNKEVELEKKIEKLQAERDGVLQDAHDKATAEAQQKAISDAVQKAVAEVKATQPVKADPAITAVANTTMAAGAGANVRTKISISAGECALDEVKVEQTYAEGVADAQRLDGLAKVTREEVQIATVMGGRQKAEKELAEAKKANEGLNAKIGELQGKIADTDRVLADTKEKLAKATDSVVADSYNKMSDRMEARLKDLRTELRILSTGQTATQAKIEALEKAKSARTQVITRWTDACGKACEEIR
ncbi:MAG: hypothetical protein NTV36_02920 [Candidatus Staskawiczbacteria bacterium]|nr:hypothetical protein [Candidatus Staskawiczbacteria bacterium]